jgi:tRNA1Val (adenine37-N6)-methyltransferase
VLRGRVQVHQPAGAARVTSDPILLAHFVHATCRVRARRAFDLGAGSGALALALAALDPRARLSVVGLELDSALCVSARRGAELSGLARRVEFRCADVTAPAPAAERASADLVVSNPPFHRTGTGPLPRGARRALAHHQIGLALPAWAGAARARLQPGGAFALIYPPEPAQELLNALVGAGFRLRALRTVHPRADRPARRLLTLWQLGGGVTCRVHPPLILHEGAGFSAEAQAILDGRVPAAL